MILTRDIHLIHVLTNDPEPEILFGAPVSSEAVRTISIAGQVSENATATTYDYLIIPSVDQDVLQPHLLTNLLILVVILYIKLEVHLLHSAIILILIQILLH